MRLVACVWIFLGMFGQLYSQATCDIITNGISVNTTSLEVGQTTTATFEIFNDAGGDNCFYPVNSVLVVLSFPDEGLAYDNIISPAMGPFFIWNYESGQSISFATNNAVKMTLDSSGNLGIGKVIN